MRIRRLVLTASLISTSLVGGAASARSQAESGARDRMIESQRQLRSEAWRVSGRDDPSPADRLLENRETISSSLLLVFPSVASGGSIAASRAEAPEVANAPASPSPSRPAEETRSIEPVIPYQPLLLGSLGASGWSASTKRDDRSGARLALAKGDAARSSPPASSAPAERADAFLNFGDGPYPAADRLIGGEPGPWHESEVVADILGGRAPSASEQSSFADEVLTMVDDAFAAGKLDVDLTTTPGSAAHTLSIVSGAYYPDNPEAIGIADIGGDGFTLIDNFENVDSIDDLKVAVANNVSHELMHVFGVGHHDDSGGVIDSARPDWSVLTDENAAFSAEAVAELAAVDFQDRWDDDLRTAGLQTTAHLHDAEATHVTPEPTTVALWAFALVGCAWTSRGRLTWGRPA